MGDRKGTALLLAAAAVVGTVLGAAASMASAKASGAWQAAVRRQLEHDAIRAGLDQLHQLSDARRSGAKRSRAVFALSLVALAGVLAGRAAVFGAGRSASTCLAAAAVSLVAAAAWGITALPLGS